MKTVLDDAAVRGVILSISAHRTAGFPRLSNTKPNTAILLPHFQRCRFTALCLSRQSSGFVDKVIFPGEQLSYIVTCEISFVNRISDDINPLN